MVYFFDIDNTICKTEGNDYENAVPYKDRIKKINKLFESGHVVIYWTSRGNTSNKDWRFYTMKQLNEWGCRYNTLRTGKPSYDFLIDDKALRFEEL